MQAIVVSEYLADILNARLDPYYFLQYDAPGSEPAHMKKDFATSLLSMDVDGRVIRIDRSVSSIPSSPSSL